MESAGILHHDHQVAAPGNLQGFVDGFFSGVEIGLGSADQRRVGLPDVDIPVAELFSRDLAVAPG